MLAVSPPWGKPIFLRRRIRGMSSPSFEDRAPKLHGPVKQREFAKPTYPPAILTSVALRFSLIVAVSIEESFPFSNFGTRLQFLEHPHSRSRILLHRLN